VHSLGDNKPLVLDGPLGTAFFVLYPDSRGGPDYGFSYVVTAKHVLKDGDGSFLKEIRLRLNLLSPTGQQACDFIYGIPVSDEKGDLFWFHDADDAVDIAALPLLPDEKRFDFKAIPTTMFADDTKLRSRQVGEGDSLYFIGLMTQYYGETKNYPVVRRGTLALMTDEKIDTPTGKQKAFIAELPSWPGNSGSPVLLNLGGLRGSTIMAGSDLSFLGILSGSFLNRFRATMLNAQTVVAGNDFNTGISFIVPAERVKAVLDSPGAQAQRDAEIQRLPKAK
jgi:S1-C subfamily serine protease